MVRRRCVAGSVARLTTLGLRLCLAGERGVALLEVLVAGVVLVIAVLGLALM